MQKTILILSILLIFISLVLVITPYEASFLNQDLGYMLMLNFAELLIASVGVSIGVFATLTHIHKHYNLIKI